MILSRSEFASMITFMLAVIPSEEKTGKNCLFVKIDEGKYIFTAGGEHCVKRVILVAQTTILEVTDGRNKKRKIPDSFMIPRGALKAFAETLKDHKSICKKLSKGDETKLYIEIDDEEMSSIGEYVHFKQPGFQFKDLQPFFEQNTEDVSSSILMSSEIESAMTGFSKTKQVEATYRTLGSGKESAKLIHFIQKETGYESVFICPPEDIEEKGADGQEKF